MIFYFIHIILAIAAVNIDGLLLEFALLTMYLLIAVGVFSLWIILQQLQLIWKCDTVYGGSDLCEGWYFASYLG